MTLSHPGRRTAALVTGVGLVAGSLLVAPVAPAAAAPPNDSAAALAGGDWLVGQLSDDGLIENQEFGGAQYGLTIDAALSLADFGGTAYDAQLAETTATLTSAESVAAYTTFDYSFPEEPDPDAVRYAGTAAGATGKLLSFAESRGVDPTDAGGVDLRAQLEGLVTPSGRIADGDETGNNDDFANVISQTWAARGLARTGSTAAGAVTDFLLTQQCDAGYFPEAFGRGAGQACAPGDAPSVDTTAIAVLNLSATDPAPTSPTAEAIDDAAAWLAGRQAANGSVGGANTNSTGLAGWALATVGSDAAAERAAAWVAGVQVAGFEPCERALVPGDTGAIALGPTQLERDTATGINTPAKQDQWRLAAAQALPVLRSLPAPNDDVTLVRASNTRYVRAGSTVPVLVVGLAAGQKECVSGPGTRVSVTGPDSALRVSVPRGTGTRTYRLNGADDSVALSALAATRFTVQRSKNAVARGARQTVTMRDLAPREKVTVRLRGSVVATGVATQAGFFRSTFVVRGKTGRAQLKVTGQFPATRFGTSSFQVR